VTETAAPLRLSTHRVPRSGCLPSCHAELGFAPAPGHARFLNWFRSVTRAPFSPRSRRHVRQHVLRSAPRPASPRRLALRLDVRDDARCVAPTSAFSLLVSVPAPRRFRPCHLLAQLHDSGDGLMHVSAIRFGGPHEIPGWGLHRDGRCLPVVVRACRTSDTPVAPPAVSSSFARCRFASRVAEVTHEPARVNEPTRNLTWGAFHRSKTSAPRRPFRRPARASIGAAAWPPRYRPSTPLQLPDPPLRRFP
jgi:hypothetical protein